ncbi:hypothetical protein Tco_0787770, partial [Tanacetum coccineum]
MSSASSAVTYTFVYTDSEPRRVFWGADEEIPDGEEDLDEETPEEPVRLPAVRRDGDDRALRGHHLGYWQMGIQMRAAVASTTSLLPSTSHRTDVPEDEMPPRKKACFATSAPRCEIGESSAAGAARRPGPTLEVDTWDEIVEAMMEIAPTTLEGVDQRVTELDTTVRQRNEEFQVRFEEAHDDRAYLNARVNSLFRDRPYHRHTALALDREAVSTLIAQTTSLQTRLTSALGRITTLETRDHRDLRLSQLRLAAAKKHQKIHEGQNPPPPQTTPTSTVTNAQLHRFDLNQGLLLLWQKRDCKQKQSMADNIMVQGTVEKMNLFSLSADVLLKSGKVCILYSSKECLDVVELHVKEPVGQGCCISNAMTGP